MPSAKPKKTSKKPVVSRSFGWCPPSALVPPVQGPKKAVVSRSLSWIVLHAPSFVRRDPGGRRARNVARHHLSKAGIDPTVAAVEAYLLGAKGARDTIDRYLEPVWQRLREIIGR